jgi:effector-binding domain-containing protein
MTPMIKQTEQLTVAYKVMRGPYEQAPDGYGSLYQWVEHYGLKPTGMPEALYLTIPDVTPEAEAEWELWAPIAGGAGETGPDEQGFGVKRIEPEVVASDVHKGPYQSVREVYDRLFSWIEEHGYQVVGPPREIYYSDPEEVPPEEHVTEVQMPVAKA